MEVHEAVVKGLESAGVDTAFVHGIWEMLEERLRHH